MLTRVLQVVREKKSAEKTVGGGGGTTNNLSPVGHAAFSARRWGSRRRAECNDIDRRVTVDGNKTGFIFSYFSFFFPPSRQPCLSFRYRTVAAPHRNGEIPMTQNTRYVNFHARPVSVFLHQTPPGGFFIPPAVCSARPPRARVTSLLFYTARAYVSRPRTRRLGNGFEPLVGRPAAVVTWPNLLLPPLR